MRGRAPHELSRTAELFLDLQEHRRRSSELHGKPLVASIPSFARKRWRVDGVRGAVAQAAYAALGRPHWLRRSVVRRLRFQSLDASRLVGYDAGSMDLRVETDVRNSLLRGWSFAEAEGRWTDGPEAAIALRNPQVRSPISQSTSWGCRLLHPQHPAIEVEIWVNDRYVDTWTYRLEEAAPSVVSPPSRRNRSSAATSSISAACFRRPMRPMQLGPLRRSPQARPLREGASLQPRLGSGSGSKPARIRTGGLRRSPGAHG